MINTIYFILPFASCISVLWLGIIVLLNDRKSSANKALFRAILSIVIWLFATAFMFLSDSESRAIFFDRLGYIGVVFIPITIYHLGLAVSKIERKKTLIIGYLLSILFLLLSQTNYFVSDIYRYSWGVHTQARLFHNLFILYFVIYIGMFFEKIYSYRNRAKGVEKAQANYILVAFFILNLSSLAFLPAYGINIPPFTYLFAVVCVLILTLAITKYHLFQMKMILTELLVGIMGAILVAVPFWMPSITLIILTSLVFALFCIFGYCLIIAIREESRRREEAEMVAVKEHELRQNAEELTENLKHLDRAKNQFLLSTQHHLRSPLSVIQGYLSMIGEGSYGKLPAKAKDKVDVSLDATKKLICIVDELLDVAHFQMNKGVAFKEPVDAVKLVENIVADLGKTAQTKKIYLRFNPPAALVPMINVDPRGIREAIYNIIDNAIKYTQEGGVTVVVAAESGKLRISVADTGIGMNEKDRQGLFGRTFERGEKAKTVNANGKGIGLYLASQMIASNGGNIRAWSEGWGKGTEFTIELPMGSGNSQNGLDLIPVPKPNR